MSEMALAISLKHFLVSSFFTSLSHHVARCIIDVYFHGRSESNWKRKIQESKPKTRRATTADWSFGRVVLVVFHVLTSHGSIFSDMMICYFSF